MIPSIRLLAQPQGDTSMSLAVKSVSGAELAAYRVTVIGPVISRSSDKTFELYTSTSGRASMERWSKVPPGNQSTYLVKYLKPITLYIVNISIYGSFCKACVKVEQRNVKA